MIIRKSAAEIELMAAAGVVVAGTLALLEERLEPGITMVELDKIAEDYIRSHGGVPTSKGYKGYPAAICISPNDMIVHGIPGNYAAKEGDIISFDIGVTKDGQVVVMHDTTVDRITNGHGTVASKTLRQIQQLDGAYWFTASTSFANPAVTLARSASDTFAGIRPSDVPLFMLAQIIGAVAATVLFRWLLV